MKFSQARCEGPAYPHYDEASKAARQSGMRGVIYLCFACHDWHVHTDGPASLSVDGRRAQLDSQIAEPSTEGTRAERRADMDRYLADCQAQIERLDEEHWLLLADDHAAVCMSHELVWSWQTATASRWYLAQPERYMTPDSLARPDWDHSHYPHDEHGHIGRVTTRERPKTEADTDAEQLVATILADLASEEN